MQEKAIAHPVDSRLLEIARHNVISAAKRAGIACKQTYAKEGKTLRRKAGGYAHPKQFKRLRKTVKRQRTILGVVMRDVQRKLDADQAEVAAGGAPANEPRSPRALSDLAMWLQRAERIRTQQRSSKNKLYALHAPEVECISKGKARNPYEFGVKVSLVDRMSDWPLNSTSGARPSLLLRRKLEPRCTTVGVVPRLAERRRTHSV